MSTKTKATFYELCRLCLESPGKRKICKNEDLADDIHCFTGVKISPSDNLPQMICKECRRIIEKIKNLKKKAKTNDAHLRFLFDEEDTPAAAEETSPNEIKFIIKENKIIGQEEATTDRLPSKEEKDDVTSSITTKPPHCLSCRCGKDVKTNSQSQSTSRTKHDRVHSTKSMICVRKDLFAELTLAKRNVKEEPKPQVATKSLKEKINYLVTDNIPEKPPDIKKFKKEASSESVYKCTICNKTFTVWKKYYHHKRLHIKSVMCPFDACLKRFSTKNDLAKHVRTHTGEKPYKCSFCDKSFTQNVTMKNHELSHYKATKQPKADY